MLIFVLVTLAMVLIISGIVTAVGWLESEPGLFFLAAAVDIMVILSIIFTACSL